MNYISTWTCDKSTLVMHCEVSSQGSNYTVWCAGHAKFDSHIIYSTLDSERGIELRMACRILGVSSEAKLNMY